MYAILFLLACHCLEILVGEEWWCLTAYLKLGAQSPQSLAGLDHFSWHTREDERNAEVANRALVQMVTPVPAVTTWQGSQHHAVGREYIHTATVTWQNIMPKGFQQTLNSAGQSKARQKSHWCYQDFFQREILYARMYVYKISLIKFRN